MPDPPCRRTLRAPAGVSWAETRRTAGASDATSQRNDQAHPFWLDLEDTYSSEIAELGKGWLRAYAGEVCPASVPAWTRASAAGLEQALVLPKPNSDGLELVRGNAARSGGEGGILVPGLFTELPLTRADQT